MSSQNNRTCYFIIRLCYFIISCFCCHYCECQLCSNSSVDFIINCSSSYSSLVIVSTTCFWTHGVSAVMSFIALSLFMRLYHMLHVRQWPIHVNFKDNTHMLIKSICIYIYCKNWLVDLTKTWLHMHKVNSTVLITNVLCNWLFM